MQMDRIPEVVQVYADTPHSVVVYFDDGRIKRFDASELLERGGVFLPLRDEEAFRSRCTVMNGTLAWDLNGNRDETTCLDIDPIAIWSDAPDIDEPEPFLSLGRTLDFSVRGGFSS